MASIQTSEDSDIEFDLAGSEDGPAPVMEQLGVFVLQHLPALRAESLDAVRKTAAELGWFTHPEKMEWQIIVIQCLNEAAATRFEIIWYDMSHEDGYGWWEVAYDGLRMLSVTRTFR